MTYARMRRGFLLPLVLVVVVLMSLVLYYFHFVALSEYSQVHKIAYNYQLDLIVDSALIEMAIQQEKQAACPGVTPPPWIDDVIPEIEGDRPANPDAPGAPSGEPRPPPGGQGGPQGIPLGGPREVDPGRTLPGTDEVTRGSGNDPASVEIKTTVGPFHHVPAEYDAKAIYAEPVFEDRQKDVVAWHLRGPIKVEARLKTSGRAAGELVSTWNGTVAITDATPIASDFALFSYQPPTCEDEARSIDQSINDLQRGGRFTVHARKVGRVLVRGPFLVLPEDAGTQKTYLTDPDRGAGDHAPSFSYVESKWKGWSAIPGPRALLPPPLSLGNQLLKDALDFLHGLWDKIPTIGEVEAQRPKREHSPVLKIDFKLPQLCVGVSPGPRLCTPGQIGPWEFPPLSVVIGLASGGEPTATFGAWWSIIPDDEVGRFATGMYFHGLRKPGEQLFSIMGRTQDPVAGAGDETVHDLFRGVRFKASEDDPAYADFSGGIAGLVTGDGEDNEVILPEPVPRTTGGARPDLGLIAHYGVAIFDAQTLFDIGVIELLKEVLGFSLPGGFLLGKLVTAVMNALGIRPDIYIVLRQWKVKGYDLTDDPENLTAEKVTEVFENALPDNIDADDLKPMGIVSPYGMYQYTHSVNSWNRIKESLLNFATNALVNKAVSFAVGKLGQFIGWLFKSAGSRVGSTVDQIRALGGAYVRDNKVLSAIFKFCRGFSDKLFKLLLRVGVTPATIKNLLRDQAKDQAQSFLQGKIRDPNGFLPRPVKALLGVFGPEAVDHPFKARFDAAMDATKGMRESARSYPYGFLPPKYSSWASLATRTYPDMQAYLDAERVDGVLPLRGIVLLRELDYKGDPIKYRGAGIIVVVTTDETKGPRLEARVEPVEGNDRNWLTLVHLVSAEVFEKKEREPLKLGELFTGTVYAETGVAPAGRGCLIFGNLVCGHINKRKIDKNLKGPEEGVTVRYADEVLPGMLEPGKKPLWSVEVLGTSLPPPPPTN